MGARTYELFYDGDRLRLVALRTSRGVYWVSNTLLLSVSNRQMLAIAQLAAARRPQLRRPRHRAAGLAPATDTLSRR